MVKVECNGCGSPYTVSEKRIPDAGLKMRCPKCGTTFVVHKTGEVAPGAPAPAAAAGAAAKPASPAAPAAPPKPAPPKPPARPAAPKGAAIPKAGAQQPADDGLFDLPQPAAAPAAGAAVPPGRGAKPAKPALPPRPGQAKRPAADDGDDLPLPAAAKPEAKPGSEAEWDLPEAAQGKAAPATDDIDFDLPLVADPRSSPAAGDEFDLPLPVASKPGGNAFDDDDLPLPQAQDEAALPALAGTDRNLPAAAHGPGAMGPHGRGKGLAPAVGLGSTMRSLGAPPPPPQKAPIFRKGAAATDRADELVGAVADSGLDFGAADGGFGVLDLGLPPSPEHAPTARMPGRPVRDGDEDLPLAVDVDLPSAVDADLPMPHEAGLPVAAQSNLPVAAQAGLPAVSKGNLPAVAQAGLPAVAQAGLPSPAQAGLPSPAQAGLPARAQAGLPAVAGAGAPSTQPAGGRKAAVDGSEQAGAEAALDVGFDDLPPATSAKAGGGASDLEIGPAASEAYGEDGNAAQPAVGDEFELDAAQKRTGAGKAEPESEKPASEGVDADGAPVVELAPKRSRALRIGVVAMVLLALGGGALSLTPLGAFGYYAISDRVKRSKHEQTLLEERTKAQTDLEQDTAASARAALEQARRAQLSMPRFAPIASYTAYVAYMKSVRFGADSQDKALGKQLLETVGAKEPSDMQTLGQAASDVVDGQLARARQSIEALSQSRADDVDVAVLAAEIALSAKTPKPAVKLWEQAVKLKKSGRTLFGLARAQLADGSPKEAEKSARAVLELSPKHAGARTLIAMLLWREMSREQDAMALLEEVTKEDGPVSAAASSLELSAAHCQLGEIHLARSRMTAAEKEFAAALKLEPQAEQALVGNGELFYRAGRFSEALARFEATLRVNPDSVDAKIGTAKTWLSQERAKDARELLKKAVDAGTKDPLVGFWLGQAEEALGNRDAAEASYRRAIKDGGGETRAVTAYVGLANLLTSQGKTAEAAQVLTDAASKLPQSSALAVAQGDMAMQAGRLDEAKAEFRHAIELDPQNLGSKFKLGSAMRRARDLEGATKQFEEVSKVDPEYPGLSLEWGLLYEDAGQIDRAQQMYAEALKKAPNDVDLKLRMGSTQVVSGHAKTAVPLLKEVMAVRPDSAEVNYFLGRAQLVQRSLSETVQFLKRATEIDPNRAEYLLYLGWAQNEAGNPADAEQALNKALALDKNLGDVYWQLAIVWQRRGATLDALAELKIALEKRPSRYEAYATMAACYEDQNDVAAATDAWRRAIAGNGDLAEWHYRLGKILARQNRTESAPELSRAVDLAEQAESGPKPVWLPDAHFLLGEALRSTDREKALAHFRRFLELAPGDNAYRPDAERAVAQLKPPGQP